MTTFAPRSSRVATWSLSLATQPHRSKWRPRRMIASTWTSRPTARAPSAARRPFRRGGGPTSIRTNCRIICATPRDLKAMVERGEFREDLYYRLRGITLEVPALRARLGDLPRIAENLLVRIAAERVEPVKTLAQ